MHILAVAVDSIVVAAGKVQDVEISAKTGAGLDQLLEAIALQSELLELKANLDRATHAAVIETKLDTGRIYRVLLEVQGCCKLALTELCSTGWGKESRTLTCTVYLTP